MNPLLYREEYFIQSCAEIRPWVILSEYLECFKPTYIRAQFFLSFVWLKARPAQVNSSFVRGLSQPNLTFDSRKKGKYLLGVMNHISMGEHPEANWVSFLSQMAGGGDSAIGTNSAA